ncbi:MAG TPA: pentapeptide repeat-containing protein [Ktedonobacteraceae bacterium]
MSGSEQIELQQSPALQDSDAWRMHWETQGQAWRTEPEIAAERQADLRARLSIKPDLDHGIYPFKDIKLNRADVEWLLAHHENGRGPVNYSYEEQRERRGLDLRGALLQQVDLQHLPLAHMLGGLNWQERNRTPERRDMAAVHLEGAILSWAHLEGAELYMAHLEKADFYMAHLQGASVRKAHLEGASLRMAHLEGMPTTARGSEHEQEHEESSTYLPPADLRAAFFDNATDLRSATLGSEAYGFVRFADVQWRDTNLGVIDWSDVTMLGDERRARQHLAAGGKRKDTETRVNDYREAMRANRQLAVALRNQGLNEEAVDFLYRAQQLARSVLYLRRKPGAYLFSIFLDLLAGYGYKPVRSVIAYLFLVTFFTGAYYFLGHRVGPHLSLLGAFVFSLTSFHGRGFFPGGIVLDDPLTVIAAFEAVLGLTIEISFIATFTQRFFGN